MRLLNSEYLYLVLGSEVFTPTDPSNLDEIGGYYSYAISEEPYAIYYKNQRHFLVRLTDGAMFHFDASGFNVEINKEGLPSPAEPALFGKYSLLVNDNNIYFAGTATGESGEGLFKLDTSDPSNLTATRISFSEDIDILRFLVNQNGEYIYTGNTSATDSSQALARYSTTADTGFVPVTDGSANKRFPGYVCPDDTIYLAHSAHTYTGPAYTADTSGADVASQTAPAITQLSPNPWQYTKGDGTTGTFEFISFGYSKYIYTYYNLDGIHRSTLTISDTGDVWELCGSGAPSRLSGGSGTLVKTMTSNGNLYILSSDGVSNELRSFDPVTESDTLVTSSCASCVWTDFRVNGVDDVTLYGSDPGTSRTNVIHRIYADGTEEELSADTDVSEVYQVERFF